MRRSINQFLPAILLVAGGLAGCQAQSPTVSSDAADDVPPAPQITFQGKPDSSLVGTWVSDAGDSIYELGKNGKLETTSLAHAPGGKSPLKVSRDGLWGVSGTDLFTETQDKTGNSVGKFHFEKKGNTLTLSIPAMKVKSVFHRK
jgi:hypothetical protein